MKAALIAILENAHSRDLCELLNLDCCVGINCINCPFDSETNKAALIEELKTKGATK